VPPAIAQLSRKAAAVVSIQEVRSDDDLIFSAAKGNPRFPYVSLHNSGKYVEQCRVGGGIQDNQVVSDNDGGEGKEIRLPCCDAFPIWGIILRPDPLFTSKSRSHSKDFVFSHFLPS